MFLKLTLQYNGHPYHGWQRMEAFEEHAPNPLPTVQVAVENALKILNNNQPTEIFAAGRTDKGVHATGQVVHTQVQTNFPLIRYLDGMNANLRPHPISVTAVEEVTEDFHARFSATARTYRYILYNRRQPNPLIRHTAGLVRTPLNWEKIKEAITHIPTGENDWTTFRSAECQANTAKVNLHHITLTQQDSHTYTIEIKANRFLHHMVRTLIGTLIEIGQEKRPTDDIPNILKKQDRTLAGANAHPAGLCLKEITYPDHKILQSLIT